MARYTIHPPLYAGSRYSTARTNHRAQAIADQIPDAMLGLNNERIRSDVILRFGVPFSTASVAVRFARRRAISDAGRTQHPAQGH